MRTVNEHSRTIVTTATRMLHEIEKSRAKGHAIGVAAKALGDRVYITGVSEVQDIANSTDKLIILRKHDLQGRVLPTHEICLSEISYVVPYRKKYNDDLTLFERSLLEFETEPLFKVRRHEQNISRHELRIILIKAINSGYRLMINLVNDAQLFEEPCYVVRVEADERENVTVSRDIEGLAFKVVNLADIDSIEFESFFYYKGLSSKVFRVVDEY